MELNATQKKHEGWKNDIIAAGLLMAFAFFINRGIEIKGLYMDDLYLWSCFGEQSFFEYVFPIGGTRFRFLYYLASYIQLALVGTHIDWLVSMNIFLNGLLAATLYHMGKRLSNSRFIGFLCGIMYLLSRMSYYQIGQVYGLMETMALWAAVGILYCLYQFLNCQDDMAKSRKNPSGMTLSHKYFLAANGLYFSVCFIHERYMVLLPLFYLSLLCKKARGSKCSGKDWLWPSLIFILVQLIRFFTIGSILPAGTGGTEVANTFDVKEAFGYALSQAAYVFGINAGPTHLNGLSWWESPRYIMLLVIAADLVLVVFIVLFLAEAVRRKEKRKRYLTDSLLFLGFIACCIASSSVTIRVEMRWVYVSLSAALLYLSYMYGAITAGLSQEYALKRLFPYGLLFLLYLSFMFPVETFYRGNFINLYLWPNQLRYNSLAEETYGKYGEDILGKTVYILGNTYEMSDFTASTFLKVYDKDNAAGMTKMIPIKSIRDIGQVKQNMVILREEPAFNAYQDVTDMVREMKCESITGYYRDGWMDEDAVIRVMAGSTGMINLELIYPQNPEGNEISRIYMNGELSKEVEIRENISYVTLETAPFHVVELRFENSFYIRDALEQRGEKRLSMLVNIAAD